MDLDLDRFSSVAADAQPGMNLISADFDLIMVNRVNERLYGKPVVELLGKKCYREFEKREEPCPHCPGRLSLISGESHEAETEGIRDDGTWFSARVRTHPVQGPGNQPTGFIEVVEDTTEEKRAEKLARIDTELQTALAAADTIQKAVVDCLEAALRVEGVDAGCVFSIDWARRELALILQRNFSADFVATLAESALESAMSGELPAHLAHVPGAPRTSELVPVVHRGQRVAVMVVGAYVYSCIPSSLRAGLHNLGATTGNAVSRILAERSRGDAVADLEAFITIAPLATWLLDPDGRLTMWNRAAESLLGWRAGEVLGRRPPFDVSPAGVPAPGSREIPRREVKLLTKDGTAIDVRLTIAPFRDLVGNASAMIVIAERLSPPKWEADVEPATAQKKSSADAAATDEAPADEGGQEASARPAIRLLVIDADRARAARAAQAVEELGWEAVVCSSLEEAALSCAGADPDRNPFSAAFVELISPDGSSGLELKARLRLMGLECPIIVCSDAEVLGYEFHGFAGLLKRPFDMESLKATVRRAIAPPT